jgi:trk system potassium uptake protein
MNIFLFGATEIGYTVASELHRAHNVTLIDPRENLAQEFANLDVHLAMGSAADVTVLEQAGMAKAEVFIACSSSDETNIVACWTAKKITTVKTICFVSRLELFQNLASPQQHRYLTEYDIDTIIWPEQMLTQDIFRIVTVPGAVDAKVLTAGTAHLLEYRLKEESVLLERRIMDCSFPDDVLIVAITRGDDLFIPNGSTRLKQGDKIAFMGTGQGLDMLSATYFGKRHKIRSVGVIGGGNVGYMLAKQLERAGISVKLVETNRKRCEFLVDNLKHTLVLNGDGTNVELLESEDFGGEEVVVCVTNNDEKNLLCSLLVKQLGVEKVITRVSNHKNSQLFERVGIDVAMSPAESAIKELRNQLKDHDVDILAMIEKGQGEVLRITVAETFAGRRIMDLDLPVPAIIGVVERNRRVTIPRGNHTIEAGDRLVIFTMARDAEALKRHFAA